MNGIDPYAYMHKVSLSMDKLKTRNEIETVLDEIEYLFEIIPPEMQDNAEKLISLLRQKLNNIV
ncbi:MAG TPA: hypothetical protein VIQ03_16025 [Gammaproteobacteria bacterium]